MANIFWVEDQFHWIDKFKPILESADFGDGNDSNRAVVNQVNVYKFVESACQAINQSQSLPDIVILDANMNGNDDAGFTVSKLLAQKWPQVPVIYLSEHSGTGIEEKAFEQTQAHDFIAKHQQNVEKVICWRIKALIRQQALQSADKIQSSEDIIKSGNLTIDLTTWHVYWHGEKLMNPNNSQRPLAPTPRKILRYLVESSPRPLTTMQMSDKLDAEKFNYANYRQHIKTLRHSFEKASIKNNHDSFLTQCKSGKGIVTFGDDGAYCWVT
ncbi:response regulator transcription factor [Aliikangiella sp. IMCC44359]|uniref:response regulator transcription factor n=1 Tax=Aliikangiella sp. IMCC44359 TaxID=3459125 RepID=UPI00403AE95E